MKTRATLRLGLLALCIGSLWQLPLAARAAGSEQVDVEMASRIRQEAFQRSQVMASLTHLTEVIGPRLTNSPAMWQANQWAESRLRDWGMNRVYQERVDGLGLGWEFSHARVEMLGPRPMPLHALPKAWTPGTSGPVEGEVVALKLATAADLEKHAGTLRGKILFVDEAREYKPGETADFHRHDEASLNQMRQFAIPKDPAENERAENARRFRERADFQRRLRQYLQDEGVLAVVGISGWDNGIIRVAGGGSRKHGEPAGVPDLVMISTHYNQVMRALARKEPVRLRLDVDARFVGSDDQPGYNTLAELAGSDKRDEVVMLGAHLDSWHAGSGVGARPIWEIDAADLGNANVRSNPP